MEDEFYVMSSSQQLPCFRKESGAIGARDLEKSCYDVVSWIILPAPREASERASESQPNNQLTSQAGGGGGGGRGPLTGYVDKSRGSRALACYGGSYWHQTAASRPGTRPLPGFCQSARARDDLGCDGNDRRPWLAFASWQRAAWQKSGSSEGQSAQRYAVIEEAHYSPAGDWAQSSACASMYLRMDCLLCQITVGWSLRAGVNTVQPLTPSEGPHVRRNTRQEIRLPIYTHVVLGRRDDLSSPNGLDAAS
ncbi:hypothetical protein QR685DRAFT_593911 [Neurospora intermedia]|uniref:Uncharacterized protein n=1 Tax=Neurospora intermedia TaxID=5142 RepID=A0ABR3DTW9_NEUIN